MIVPKDTRRQQELKGPSPHACKGPRRVVAWELSECKRVDDPDVGLFEVRTVVRRYDQIMGKRGSCNQAVFDGHRFPGCAKARQHFGPFQTSFALPRKTVETLHPGIEPAFERRALPTLSTSDIRRSCHSTRLPVQAVAGPRNQ